MTHKRGPLSPIRLFLPDSCPKQGAERGGYDAHLPHHRQRPGGRRIENCLALSLRFHRIESMLPTRSPRACQSLSRSRSALTAFFVAVLIAASSPEDLGTWSDPMRRCADALVNDVGLCIRRCP